MRLSNVFCDSFLDGFAFAGFLTRLQQPGEATRIFAPPQSASHADWQPLTFEPGRVREVEMAGDLRRVPEHALRTMIDLLKREDEQRKASAKAPDKAGYGTPR